VFDSQFTSIQRNVAGSKQNVLQRLETSLKRRFIHIHRNVAGS
jgi:hypothetical protein